MEFSPFHIIGISVRTTNEGGQMAQDIPALWQKLFSENILGKIPNKLEETVFSVYTDYESDYMKPYTVILGCKVADLSSIPEGMVGKTIPGGRFQKFQAKGNLQRGAVYDAWKKIWQTALPRTYTADYEVYADKAQNPLDAEVDIFIAVR